MREIKFRAWFKPTNWDEDAPKKPPRMVYFNELGYCDEYNHLKFQLAKESHDPEGGGYSNLSALNDNFVAVMQFTGLRDKNGKEIYEGDIIEHQYRDRGLVIWEAPCFRVVGDETDIYLGHAAEKHRKIIGNIYENPELLAVGADRD